MVTKFNREWGAECSQGAAIAFCMDCAVVTSANTTHENKAVQEKWHVHIYLVTFHCCRFSSQGQNKMALMWWTRWRWDWHKQPTILPRNWLLQVPIKRIYYSSIDLSLINVLTFYSFGTTVVASELLKPL